MNTFQLLGDLLHLFAAIDFPPKIWRNRSCAGVSGKSQILFAITYTTRYVDLFAIHVSAYNSITKICFILASLVNLYLVYYKFWDTYDYDYDTFRIELLLLPALILALIINYEFTVLGVLATFSIYLESVAILPQLSLVSNLGEIEGTIGQYLLSLGGYRVLYFLSWGYRYIFEGHYYDYIAIVPGLIQTTIYYEFFHQYIVNNIQ